LSKRLLFLPCVAIAALALAACGSSDETAEIEDVIVASATADEPANCTRLNTRHFNEQIAGVSGTAAVRECEEEAEKEEGLDSVEISKVEVDGSDATAQVALTGGGLNGQSIEVALIEDGDQWKLDEIVKFTKFDASQMAQAFEAQVNANPGEISRQVVACLADAFASASRVEAEELRLSGSRDAFEELFEGCTSSSNA
jgi:hypothetical protein